MSTPSRRELLLARRRGGPMLPPRSPSNKARARTAGSPGGRAARSASAGGRAVPPRSAGVQRAAVQGAATEVGGAEQSADEQHELALRKHARALLNGGSPVDERLGAAFHLHASVCAHAKLTDAVAHVERLFAICAAEASASREVRASHAGEAEAGIGSGAALAVRSACELLGDGGELIALPAQLLRVFALSPVGLAAVAASEAAALLCAALRVPSAGLRHCALPLLAQLAEQRTTAHALARAGAVRSLKAVCAQEGCDALDWHHALRIVDGLSATAAGLRAITSARAHTWLEAAAARCDGGRGQHLRLSAADGALLRRLSAELAAVAQMVGRPTLQRAAVPTSALGGGAGAMAPRTAWGGAEDGRIIRLPLRPSQQAGAQQADSGALLCQVGSLAEGRRQARSALQATALDEPAAF